MNEPSLPEESIFAQALEINSHSELEAFLQRACGDNQTLRTEVEALLRADAQSGDLLDLPEQPAVTIDETPAAESPGARIGPYKLLESIGEGGFGIVYMAEQTEPVRRKVALKVLKPGMDTRQIVARFEAERQALALMDHPNIAKVFDGGATDSGRPYFVMELVRGVPITDYCDAHQLSLRERLELFVHVCQAVQHAHQKGIIHRDLKPSNVLVSRHDTMPIVKVIDFGVAKAPGQELTDKTLFTGINQMVGTPLYMSPEQAGMSDLDVDTRSDIYSLGVLLYELLTGTTPFTKERFKQAAYDEIRRIIREEDPPKPSTRLTTTDTLASIAANRRLEPKKLSYVMRGELDWIVMMTLEKDRNRRYETANGLAADVRRYLNDEQVRACPPSAAYRLRKFVRRNRVALMTATLTGAALVAAVVVLAISTVRISQEKEQKEEALGQANANAKQAADNLVEARRQLFHSKVSEAQASRRRREIGQRFQSLKVLEEATRLARELGQPEDDFLTLRNEVIACLALPDLRVAREWPGWPASSWQVTFDAQLERYVRVDRQGNVTVRRIADDGEICHFHSDLSEVWPKLSPDGRFLMLRGVPSACEIWELAGREARRVALEAPDSAAYGDFSPDSRQLAVAHTDGSISLYDLPSGRRARRLAAGPIPVHLAFHPEGRQLALACPTLTQVRDVDSGKVLASYSYPRDDWPFVAWHPEGKSLATVGGDRAIYLWDVATGKMVHKLQGFKNGGINCAFNRTGDLLVSTGWENFLRLWDPRTGQELLHTPVTWPMEGARFSPDGRFLGADVKDDRLRLWTVAVGREYRTLIRDPALGKGDYGVCAFSPKDRLLAAGMLDGLGLWDRDTGTFLAFVPQNTADQIAFEPSGALLSNGADKLLRWPIRPDPVEGGTLRIGPAEQLSLPATSYLQVACSLDGHVLASAHLGGAYVWRPDKPDKPIPLTPQPNARFIALSPDGHWVATGSDFELGAKVWDVNTGKLVTELLPKEAWIMVAFSPDGKWLATSGDGARLWAVGSWREGPLIGSPGAFAFSPDSSLLAVETGKGVVRLLSPTTGREHARLEDPNGDRAIRLAFSPDGTQLLANGEGESLHLWDLRAIRAELAARKLDWKLSAYPPADETHDVSPLRATLDPPATP